MKYMTYYSISKFQNIEEGEQYEKLVNGKGIERDLIHNETE